MNVIMLIVTSIWAIIATICCFFKSALNDIVKEIWVQRCKRKESFRNHLIELRQRLLTIQRLECNIVIYYAIILYDSNMAGDTKLCEFRDKMLKESGQAKQFIQNNEAHYPEDIRKLFRECQKDFSGGLLEIVQKGINKNRLLEMTDILSEKLSSLISLVDHYLT